MAVAHTNSSAAFLTLLSHYMSGEITLNSWQQMMKLLDTSAVSRQERIALAAFFDDAVVDIGADDLKIPLVKEANDLIKAIRAN